MDLLPNSHNVEIKEMHKKRLSNVISENVCGQKIVVEIESKAHSVLFKASCEQTILPNFNITNLGCYICQKNFRLQSDFDDHVSFHGFQSNHKFLSTILVRQNNIFKVSYRLCRQSHFFYFTMATNEKDIIIERIIIIQTRLMHYVKNDEVPYELPSDGLDSFLVDSHVFTKAISQPIVIIFRKKFDTTTRYVEEHHFLRCEEFPTANFSTISHRIPAHPTLKQKHKLGEYIPKERLGQNCSVQTLKTIFPDLNNYIQKGMKLNSENVTAVCEALLKIEDWEILQTYFPLRQKRVKVKKFGKECSVKFSQLPPGVILDNIVSVSDIIILLPSKSYKTVEIRNDFLLNIKGNYAEAVIEGVYPDEICFKYVAPISTNERYDIIVRPSRLLLRYQYRALNLLSYDSRMRKYLLPEGCNPLKNLPTIDLELFNPTIAENPEQLQAIINIVANTSNFAPFILFGPPGTGKTSTLVEAVLQVWKCQADSFILITSGSNAACDEIAIRLCNVLLKLQSENPLIRLYSKSNEKRLDNIDDALLEYSNMYQGHFFPAIEIITRYRIIVCTLAVVGKLLLAPIRSFTHIFIDECGASTVPELLVGLVETTTIYTKIILAGDHKQLGPILKSQNASKLGLGTSLLENLQNRECYAVDENGEYDRSIQSRLIRNYRSHPDIVNLYNQLYYDNKLIAMSKAGDSNWALNWHLLPNKKYPVIFHPIYGKCCTDIGSTSWYNQMEIAAVMLYVQELMVNGLGDRKINESDIGIISPYKRQYMLIQKELRDRKWDQIQTGSAEIFQGMEKPIIIISTVRSFTFLGFVDNSKRTNVMLSRAKSLLIIIGNPKTLKQSKDFTKIIDQCFQNKCTVPKQKKFKNKSFSVASLLNKLSLNDLVEPKGLV